MTNAPRLAVVPRVDARAQRATGAELFHAFHTTGIRYCFWKSDPDELERGLHGASDLDVLIDRADSRRAAEVLVRCGFKRFAPAPGKAYPAVEDYLGLDAVTGALLHCHAHYRLLIGRPNVKEYRLPWEDVLLATRRLDVATGVYVADPDVEILLLVLRFATKLRARDLMRGLLGRPVVTAEWRRQLARLGQRGNWARSRTLCAELLGERFAARFAELVSNPVRAWRALFVAWAARRELRRFRRSGRIGGLVHRWWRALAWAAGGVSRRSLRIPFPFRRTVPSGGLVVAVLGPDGSGKSTITREVAAAFATKLDVFLVYFGSGDGPGSLVRWPLRVARRVVKRFGLTSRRRGVAASPGAPPHERTGSGGLPLSLALTLWALALSLEKRRKLRSMWRARNLGMIVLADRYPQAQVMGFNDGPLLSRFSGRRSALLRRLARWESAPYLWAERYPPDLIVKLNVTPATALQRKPETSPSEVARRIGAVRRLAYLPPATVVDVDADRPLSEVSLAVKRAVWDLL